MTDETMLTGMGEWSDGTPSYRFYGTQTPSVMSPRSKTVFEHILKRKPVFFNHGRRPCFQRRQVVVEMDWWFCFPRFHVLFSKRGARPLWPRQRFKRRSTFQRPVLGNQRHVVVSTTFAHLVLALWPWVWCCTSAVMAFVLWTK